MLGQNWVNSSGGIDKEGEDELVGNRERGRSNSISLDSDIGSFTKVKTKKTNTVWGLTRSRKGLTRSRRVQGETTKKEDQEGWW